MYKQESISEGLLCHNPDIIQSEKSKYAKNLMSLTSLSLRNSSSFKQNSFPLIGQKQ